MTGAAGAQESVIDLGEQALLARVDSAGADGVAHTTHRLVQGVSEVGGARMSVYALRCLSALSQLAVHVAGVSAEVHIKGNFRLDGAVLGLAGRFSLGAYSERAHIL